MESKQQTASVILKLMGLDHVPSQYHPFRDRQKVLSEDYLQKVASIGVRKKRSSHRHQSIEKEESDDVLKVVKTIKRDENHNPSKGNGKQNLSLYETKVEGVLQQLLDAAVMSKPETWNSRIAVSKVKLGKEGIGLKYSSFLHSRQNSCFGKQGSRSCREVSEKVSMQTGNVGNGVLDSVSSSFKRNIRCKVGVNYRFAMTRSLCEASVIADNCATLTKDDLFQKYWGLRKNVSVNCSTQKSKKQNIIRKYCSEDVNLRSSSEKSTSSSSPAFIHSYILQQTRLMNDDVKNNKHEDSSMSKQSAVSTDSLVDCLVSDAKAEVVDWSQNNPIKHEFDSLSHTSLQQDTSEFQEDSACSTRSEADPDSVGSFHDTYEPSPISVLDPTFSEDISSISECGAGAYDSSEVDDGLDMNVSSDEECENESVGDFAEKKDIIGLSRTEESRDFSYVVEVLTEAGISNRSLFKDFSTWHTAECPISPSVFEILEKKFGEQQHWKRCERRLLFDRINLGLLEILQPQLYVPKWEKPVSRRVISEPSQDMIEEEMWGLLVSQEKKVSKDSEDNKLGGEIRWIEISEDVEDIVRNIVKLLIEELANEIVSLEDF